ncbi:MAG: methyltransferase domain-containing protein [Bacteroidetes bacterium]|nr:methyltransferase domain-containing protein [Bacteroidota bacterium]MBK9672761.1 methyltransferase domain-containing protein [Bacteroidota bacterium]MBP6412020.1 methyltransferase domain-containing protein [Bacteroidia bacterium]
MKNKTEIKIFLASPTDTVAERDLIQKYIEEWNSTYGDDERNIQLRIVRWENDLNVQSNVNPQEVINEDLLKDCDILTGIFWTKFGSSTDKLESATSKEIEYFLLEEKPILMYFLEKPIKPSEASKLSDQLKKINDFREKYKVNNIYRTTDLVSPDEFRKMFMRDLNMNIKKLLTKPDETNSRTENVTINSEESKDWYKESIKKLIEDKLVEYNLLLAYRREISFDENLKLWRSTIETRHPDTLHKITKAREEAFNIKYGHYDYEKDLREKYSDSWFTPIISILNNEAYSELKEFSVLGVASNNGIELKQIFKKYPKSTLSVLDLSEVAIKNGQKSFSSIKYLRGNMEDCTIINSSIDVYLNLRSIHSSGVDIRMTLTECHRLLKPNGIAIFSVSNGYLTPNEIRKEELVETKGMYDNRIEAFSTEKPYELANKIRFKLDNYGFRLIEIHTGETEIFIKAIK